MKRIQDRLIENLSATVTVSGVVMEINENSVSCIGGVSVLTRFIEEDGKFIPTKESSVTCTDNSGKFSISEIVTNIRKVPIVFQSGITTDLREVPIVFQIDKFEAKCISIYISPETNEQDVSVVIQLNRQKILG